ncbi:MAG: LamG domain-containing protein [Candidatus Kerfeldbacteria bacterium]|nr:LamG domain-containing protein [Candidatus Kerfeldbacteria bacterium]
MRFFPHNGFSLIDALMSIAVFALLTSGLVGALAYAYQSSTAHQQRTHALQLAEQGIEAVRSLREAAWNGMTMTQSGVTDALGVWQWVGEGTTDTLGSYTRTITLDAVCRNASDEIETCPSSYTDVTAKYVTVTINWTGQFAAARSYSTQTVVTHWDTSAWSQTNWDGGSGQSVWADASKYDSDSGNLLVSTTGQVEMAPITGCGERTWDLETASEYVYDADNIEVSGGTASLVAHGSAPDSNTVALWHLNESSGNFADTSGKNNTLTPTGLPTYDSTGQFGSAIGFGGTDHYASITDAAHTGLDIIGAMTVEAWVKKTAFSGTDLIVSKWGSTGAAQSYQFSIGNTGAVVLQLRNGASLGIGTSPAGAVTTGTWYHVAGVYDGSTIQIYVNGQMVGSTAYSAGINNSTSNFLLSGASTASFNGTLDEVRLSDVARYTSNFTVPDYPFGIYYDSSHPTLTISEPYTPTNIAYWARFTDSTTVSGSSSIMYQISDDATTWKYWNGSTWATASGVSNASTASSVNVNINNFTTTEKTLYWRAIFSSEGDDPASLDTVSVTCQLNQTWDFDTAAEYTYSSDITISGGAAVLQGGGSAPDSATVGLWHLNEASGDFIDYSGNSNDLSTSGSPTYDASGQFASGIGFDATDQYASIADGSQTGLDMTGEFTVEAWIHKTTFSGNDVIAGKWGVTTDTQGYQLFVGNLGELAFQVRNGSSSALVSSPTGAITTGEWYHVAGVYDGSSLKVFVNGEMLGSTSYSDDAANTTTPFMLSGASTASFNGTLDEVRVSSVARYSSNFTVPDHPFGVYYPTTTPTLTLASSFHPTALNAVVRWTETATTSGTSQLYYQVSNDDGATWKYWNGAAWITPSSDTDYNAASTLTANLRTLTLPNGTLQFKVFFVSEGSDQITLDAIDLRYEQDISAGIGTTAELTSSAFELGAVSNSTVVSVSKDTSACSECDVQLQVRVAPDDSGVPGDWTAWYGAEGSGDFFDATTSLIPTALNGYEWIQYKVTFTSDGAVSPILHHVTLLYDAQ